MIFDIHCHSSLKQFLFKTKIDKSHFLTAKDVFPTGMHSDLPSLKKGKVRVVTCAHYLPEYEFRQVKILGISIWKFLRKFRKIKKKLENRGTSMKPFEQTLKIMDDFENSIKKINNKKEYNVSIVKNHKELKNRLAKGDIVFLHSLEGAHSLGYNLSETKLLKNIDKLIDDYGLCQFTIAHFFDNIIVPSQGGIPPSLRKFLNLNTLRNPNTGLTKKGKIAVKHLFDRGVVIDLVHCTPAARNDIININANRKMIRPLVFSHTGLRSVASLGDIRKYPSDIECLPTDCEVKEIIRTRGTIGLIFMNYWINGTEENNPIKDDYGIADLILTIQKIRTLEEEVYEELKKNEKYKKYIKKFDCDHISIGTDFDGFTQVPDDLVTSADIPKLFKELKRKSFTKKQIEKISWKNYLRVLELGWGK